MQLVIGAGSVGTVLAGHLLAADQAVRLQIRPGRIEAYRTVQRLRVIDADERPVIEQPAPAVADAFENGDLDRIYIAVKHPDLPAVLDQLAGRLRPQVTLMPCLNGVGLAERLRERFPDNPVAPVTVMFNARVESPLVARLTTRAEILIDSDEARLLSAFEGSGMRVSRADPATEWGKLLINLNNAVCAITHTGFADLFSDDQLVRAFVRVLDEAVTVLDAAGIEYSLPAPVPHAVYRWLLLHAKWLPLWVARRKNGLSDEAYPSMLADLERGRPTEIDYLNGVITALGREHGVATPANAKLINLIHDCEAARKPAYLTPVQLNRTLEMA